MIAALALGVAAFSLSYRLLVYHLKTAPVVVAACKVEAYTRLSASDVKLAQVPLGGIPEGALVSLDQVLGSYSSSRYEAGQIIQAGHVIKGKEELGLSAELPIDTRAMFIPVDASHAAGGLLRKGERVDVICAPKGADFGQVIVLRDIAVMEIVKDSSSKEFRGALVQVSPSECELIAYSLGNSSLYLSLVPKRPDGLSDR